MEKNTLTVYTFSETGAPPESTPPTDPSGRVAKLVCFVPPGSDQKSDSWEIRHVSEKLWATGPKNTEASLRSFSVGLFHSEYSVWFDYPGVPQVNPWSLADDLAQSGKAIATPRQKRKLYSITREPIESKRREAMAKRAEYELLLAEVPNENAISTSLIVRRQCKDLWKLEKAWLSAGTRSLGEQPEAAFALAMKMADKSRRYTSLQNEKINP